VTVIGSLKLSRANASDALALHVQTRRAARNRRPPRPDAAGAPGRRTQHKWLARALIVIACRVLEAAGEVSPGLTVDEDFIPAVALYQSLGFSKAP